MPKTHFRQKDIAPLVATYQLAKTFRGSTIFQRLNGTASVYYAYKNGVDAVESNQEIREQLDASIKAIDRLERQRKNLSDGARAAFQRAIAGFETEIFAAAIHTSTDAENPIQRIPLRQSLSFLKIDLGNDSHVAISFDEPLIDQALFSLRTYFEIARKEVRKQSAGRRQSEGLRICVYNLASIWRDHRKEPFRVTYVKGEPKSEAARFCVDAMKIIDPKIQKPRIITAMRSYASEARKQKSQEMGSENS